jgi:hypothetical protein
VQAQPDTDYNDMSQDYDVQMEQHKTIAPSKCLGSYSNRNVQGYSFPNDMLEKQPGRNFGKVSMVTSKSVELLPDLCNSTSQRILRESRTKLSLHAHDSFKLPI